MMERRSKLKNEKTSCTNNIRSVSAKLGKALHKGVFLMTVQGLLFKVPFTVLCFVLFWYCKRFLVGVHREVPAIATASRTTPKSVQGFELLRNTFWANHHWASLSCFCSRIRRKKASKTLWQTNCLRDLSLAWRGTGTS